MAYPDNLLVRGEKVIVSKRPHWKVLILPTILFVVIIAGGFFLARSLSNWQYSTQANLVIGAVALVALIVLVLVPFVRWRTEHFVITNHHVFFRTGLLSRREHQIPLGQIANMETEVTFWGRLMGYGSLIVESSADQPLKFRNVASLSKVQSQLNQLIRDERERMHRGGDRPDRSDFDDSADGADRNDQPPAGYSAQRYQQPPPGQQQYPPQQGYPATQQYPAQQGYPTQQGYPPQQGYPAQGYPAQGGPGQGGPGQGGPGQQGYPTQQGYPGQPGYPQQQSYPQGYPAPQPDYSPPPSSAPSGTAPDEGRPPQQS